MKDFLRSFALRATPPIRRLIESRQAADATVLRLSSELDRSRQALNEANAQITTLTAAAAQLQVADARFPNAISKDEIKLRITRGQTSWLIGPDLFEVFNFKDGDRISVEPHEMAARLPTTWGDVNIQLEPGIAIRVPPQYNFFDFKGFRIPVHLISLTGAGPETLDIIGKRHIDLYQRFCGLHPDMAMLEVGCGIGRDPMQLIDYLSERGRYVGIDVTRDSIVWCSENISSRYSNFEFHHFDAENELYNPHGRKTSMDFVLPVKAGSVDRIFLASVFTHLFEAEVLHYMKEFARVLKTNGQVYATFFLRTPEALESAKTVGTTQWKATFDHCLSDGVYGNDPSYPRGAVAFTDSAMRRLIDAAGLRLVQPYLRGSWSGLYPDPDDGQDVAILARA